MKHNFIKVAVIMLTINTDFYMKKILSHIIIFFLLCFAITSTQAQQFDGQLDDSKLSQQVNFQLKNADINSHIVEISRLMSVNFFADATHFPVISTPLSVEKKASIRQLLKELSIQRNVTRLQLGDNMTLFWSKPDEIELAKRIQSGESIHFLPLPHDTNIDQMLLDYFKDKLGWDGKIGNYVKDIKLSTLPPDIRVQVKAVFQRRRIQNLTSGVKGDILWFKDTAWLGAFLTLVIDAGDGTRNIFVQSRTEYLDEQKTPKFKNATTIQGVTNLDYKYVDQRVAPLIANPSVSVRAILGP